MCVHVRHRLQGHVTVSLPADLRQQLRVQLVGAAAFRRAAARPQPQGEQLAAGASIFSRLPNMIGWTKQREKHLW